ncbi:MAG: SDR family oxidoreductase [Pirellula sp.]|jgi:NAD(P)-dependent dehydrogenase (short-subunit alcohol dehydrogenase family)|nr:SDR family oxidoreductase [Pirellula sp.]
MMSDIRAVIVGAAGGIGRAVCEGIAHAGGQAFLIGRNEDKLRETSEPYGWSFCAADAGDWGQLEQAFAMAADHLQGFNGAVNLAGSVLLKPMHLTSRTDWDTTVLLNLTSAAGVVRTAVPRLTQTGGSIVLMSSAAASIGLPNHEAIAACKAGVEGLTRSSAATYADKKIRVNCVAPGLVRTPMTERVWNNPRSAEVSLAMHPLGRFGEPADVARAICFLLDPDQDWITGQTLGVDGGLGMLKGYPVRKG